MRLTVETQVMDLDGWRTIDPNLEVYFAFKKDLEAALAVMSLKEQIQILSVYAPGASPYPTALLEIAERIDSLLLEFNSRYQEVSSSIATGTREDAQRRPNRNGTEAGGSRRPRRRRRRRSGKKASSKKEREATNRIGSPSDS